MISIDKKPDGAIKTEYQQPSPSQPENHLGRSVSVKSDETSLISQSEAQNKPGKSMSYRDVILLPPFIATAKTKQYIENIKNCAFTIGRSVKLTRTVIDSLFSKNASSTTTALSLGGLSDKTGQLLAFNVGFASDLNLHETEASSQTMIGLSSSLTNLSSKNTTSIMSEAEVLSRLRTQIDMKDNSVAESIKSIDYHGYIGSGSVANISKVTINGVCYAVKTISENAKKKLLSDITILQSLLMPCKLPPFSKLPDITATFSFRKFSKSTGKR